MKLLVHDPDRRVYVVPWLDGYAYPTSNGEWLLYAGTETITVRGSVEDLDRVLVAIQARGVPPHATLSRCEDGGYAYAPWDMRIRVHEQNGGAGNSFITEIDGVTVILYRLHNLRDLVRRVIEATA